MSAVPAGAVGLLRQHPRPVRRARLAVGRTHERGSRGICSGGYKPGPLADEEYLVKQFLSWYSDQLTETPLH